MTVEVKTEKLGPILLTPGVTRVNVITKLYASGISVILLTGMGFLQGYILTEHLHIPQGQQGTVSGDLTFWAEVFALIFFTPFGILSDRIGRRPVYIGGLLLVGLGYGLYPFATSFPELLVYRIITAVGSAAVSGMLITLTNDYPQENSRGKLIGFTSMTNIAGTMLMAGGIARFPSLLIARDFDPVLAGQITFLFATGLSLVSAVITRLGLKGGTAVELREMESVNVLIMSGLRAAKNPRIALSYASGFVSRADLIIIGLFLSLWAIHDAADRGMSTADAMARFGLMIIIMQSVNFIAAPFFGWYLDRVNRVTATIVALIFASTGYLSMGIITSPLDFAMAPFFIVIALGSGFILKASLTLVGQEVSPKERGSVVTMNGTFGALGILIITLIGGRLFDTWGPWAPFVLAGVFQTILLIAAIIIRIVAPGEDLVSHRNIMSKSDALEATPSSSADTS